MASDDNDRMDAICPKCKGPALKNNSNATVVYCENSRCRYVGEESDG